jgi:hypothetical protein
MLRRDPERDCGWHILGAGSHIPLLSSPVDEWNDHRRPVQNEGADTLGAADLVGRDRERCEAYGGEVNRHMTVGGDRVDMDRHAVAGGEIRDLGDRLHGADLVVRPE